MENPDQNLKTNSPEIAKEPIREPNGQLKKGVVLNPDGRPKGSKNFTTKVKDALELIATKNEQGKEISYEEALVQKILKLAIIDGDQQMIKLIWNYLDGMPTYRLEGNISTTNYDLTPEEKEKLDKLLYADK